MAESIGSQVLGAVVVLLQATDYPTFRTRLSSFNLNQLPAYNVHPDETAPTYVVAGEQEDTLHFTVGCMASAIDQVDLQVDPLYVAAVQALQSNLTLGGLVTSLRLKSAIWKTEKRAEQDLAVLELGYEAEFSTVRGDPATAAA